MYRYVPIGGGTLYQATVVIPFDAVDERLLWCLEGIRESAQDRAYLVLVRNGPTGQKSLSEAEEYLAASTIDGIVASVEHPKPYALSSARNIGFRLAVSELVICLDSDCVPADEWFDGFVDEGRKASGTPFIAAGERRFVNLPESRKHEDRVHSQLDMQQRVGSRANKGQELDVRLDRLERLPDLDCAWDIMHGGNFATTRTSWRRCGGFDDRFDGSWGFEDAEFAYRVLQLEGATASYCRRSYVYHLEEELGTPDRPHYSENPNWVHACTLIPGFEQFKLAQYERQAANL